MEFKDLVEKLGVETENPLCSQEELKEVVTEVGNKDLRITELESQLQSKTEEYDKLKNKVIENLYNNDKKPAEEQKKKEEPKPKTFKDLINPAYLNRNNY